MEKRELLLFIKKVQNRIFLCELARIFLWYLGAGFGIGILINGVSLFMPVYGAQKIALGMILVSVILGAFYGILRFPGKKKAARLLDKKGLAERVSTALEGLDEDSAVSRLQRKDTLERLKDFPIKEKFPFLMKKDIRGYFVLLGLAVVFTATAFWPSKAREEAVRQHALREEIKEELEKAEELKKLLDTEEGLKKFLKDSEKTELKSQIDQSVKELLEAGSSRELSKAKSRLEKKVSKALEGAETEGMSAKAASLLKNYMPKLEMAESQDSQDGQEGGQNGQNGGQDSKADSTGSENGQNSQGNGENQNNSGKSEGNQKGSENGGGSNQEGSGNGNKSGQNGAGKGSGNGKSGSGKGAGYNYGSSQGVEKKDSANRGEPEKVTIPGRSVGKDENVSGKGDKGSSQYIKGTQSDGFYGEEVSYGSVLGDYSQAAYEKLKEGNIPAGMENVVKNYFDGLNE